jgi:hypothetical protein
MGIVRRHAAFAAVLLSLALGLPLANCGGPGLICSDPSDPSTCEPAPNETPDPPAPTWPPSRPRATPTPVPAGCIGAHDPVLWWPATESDESRYQNVMYIAVPQDVPIPSYFLLELGFRNAAGVDTSFEQAPLHEVTNALPPFVPTPLPDRPRIYASGDLPYTYKVTVDVILTDSRRPAQCADVVVAVAGPVTFVGRLRR